MCESTRQNGARLLLVSLISAAAACVVAGCNNSSEPPRESTIRSDSSAQQPGASPTTSGTIRFTEIASEVGLTFSYEGARAETYHLPSIMGGGAAVFDADRDGDLDVYFINGIGAELGPDRVNRLFLQQEDGQFTDATEGSGLDDRGCGMGCAIGDIDNDGDEDVYVSNLGADKLFRNDGGGRFTDITETSGIDNPHWGCSIAFLDFDRDGLLDIYVTNYAIYNDTIECQAESGGREYCGPKSHDPISDRLYRNLGDGRFEDVTEAAGIAGDAWHGLGVVCADFDDDGWIDIYVANDGDPNQLWINEKDGTFLDDAVLMGAAYNSDGREEAGMGVTAGDVDADGDLDLFVTHFSDESNTLYRNDDRLAFEDASASSSLGPPSMPYTGWGAVFFDADADGDLDLAVGNGSVLRRTPVMCTDRGFWNDYCEPNLMFVNDGTGSFALLSDGSDPFEGVAEVSRTLIPADFDRDGDQDLLITNIESGARLYRNESNPDTWIALTVVESALNREAIGACVHFDTTSGPFVRHVIPAGGYLGGMPSTIVMGLPAGTVINGIEIRWVDGGVERFEGGVTGFVEVRRGTGEVVR